MYSTPFIGQFKTNKWGIFQLNIFCSPSNQYFIMIFKFSFAGRNKFFSIYARLYDFFFNTLQTRSQFFFRFYTDIVFNKIAGLQNEKRHFIQMLQIFPVLGRMNKTMRSSMI